MSTYPKIVGTLFVTVTLCAVAIAGAGSAGERVRIDDNSDWWSWLNPSFEWLRAKAENKSVAASHFTIAGIVVHHDDLGAIQAKLGKSTVIERGDGAAWRSQACYRSNAALTKAFLIFERGEINHSFYLFTNGQDWNGKEQCTPSAQVSSQLRTGGGLRLGMSRSEVETILGRPTKELGDRIVYVRETNEKTTPDELSEIRKRSPEMSSKELQDSFGTVGLSVYIEARFSASKLSYLVVSKAEVF